MTTCAASTTATPSPPSPHPADDPCKNPPWGFAGSTFIAASSWKEDEIQTQSASVAEEFDVIKEDKVLPGTKTPFSPPSGPPQRLFQGPPAKSKFLAARRFRSPFLLAKRI
jgi:hypothetical protein